MIKKICCFFVLFLSLNAQALFAATYEQKPRHYCDTSAGRSVLNNGSFSQDYCRNTAVMLIESTNRCCAWAGGILKKEKGQVICRNGTISPICSIQGVQKFNDNPLNRMNM